MNYKFKSLNNIATGLFLGATFGAFGLILTAGAAERKTKKAKPSSFEVAALTTPTTATSPAASAGSVTSTAAPSTRFVLSYYGDFSGPAVGEVFSGGYINRNPVEGDSPLNLYNVITLGYKLQPNLRVQVQPRFAWTLVTGQSLSVLDARAGVNISNGGSLGPITLNAVSIQAELPTSSSSLKKGLLFAPRLTEDFTFANFGRFSIGTYNIQKFSIFSGSAGSNDLAMYFYPTLNFQMLPNLALNAGYEWEVVRSRTDGALSVDVADVKVKATWDVVKGLTLEPYVKLFPAHGIYSDNTLLGMEISGSFL